MFPICFPCSRASFTCPPLPDHRQPQRRSERRPFRPGQRHASTALTTTTRWAGFAFTGVLRQTQDSIEEFRVTTGDANADAGRSSGAQISMVTKSGTNKFHGAAYEYHRPTFTVANDWFNKQAQLNSGQPNIPGKLIRNIFGADVGGPSLKDKLFFFGNYEGTRQAENQQVNQTTPTATYQAGHLIYPDAKRQYE